MTPFKAQELLGRVMDIMETLMAEEGDLGIRELAERCRTSKSTIHRILLSLKEKGWVYQDEETQNYRIGVRFLLFADEWRSRLELVRLSGPIMEDLVDETGQTAILSLLEENHAVCLHKVESKNAIKLVSRIGGHTPLHATATGKTLLAFAPERLQARLLLQPLRAYTPMTITSPTELSAELERIRARGYATSIEEVDAGAASVGAPVRGPKGELVAGLSIAGPRFDFEDQWDQRISSVLRAAESLSRLIGERKGD